MPFGVSQMGFIETKKAIFKVNYFFHGMKNLGLCYGDEFVVFYILMPMATAIVAMGKCRPWRWFSTATVVMFVMTATASRTT